MDDNIFQPNDITLSKAQVPLKIASVMIAKTTTMNRCSDCFVILERLSLRYQQLQAIIGRLDTLMYLLKRCD